MDKTGLEVTEVLTAKILEWVLDTVSDDFGRKFGVFLKGWLSFKAVGFSKKEDIVIGVASKKLSICNCVYSGNR